MGSHEWELHVGVGIYTSWNDQFAMGFYGPGSTRNDQVCTNLSAKKTTKGLKPWAISSTCNNGICLYYIF